MKSVKSFCTKFQRSIITVLEIIMYAAALATFFLLFSIDNPEIISLSRTAAVTLSTYVLMLFLLTNIYGGFNVGIRKRREIVISLLLTGILTDLVTYFELTIMKTNDANNATFTIENVGILVTTVGVQAVIYLTMTILGHGFFFWINSAEKCLLISTDIKGAKKVTKAMESFQRRYRVNEVVDLCDPDLEEKMLKADSIVLYDVPVEKRTEIVDFCYQNLKNFYFNPGIADILEKNSKSEVIDDIAFYSWKFHTISFEERIVKRLMDVIISAILIVVLSPLLIISAICIKKNDGGSVLFKQKRATVHGRVFDIYKFRTMRENVENKSTFVGDDRITSVGKVLRKYRIDELPQLFNILKGDMSLVGPRPEMLENVKEYTKELPEFRYRLRMKAGLTGYAQIIGKYNTSSRDKLMLDLMYIENYSVMKDIQLLFRTVLVIFKAEDSTSAFETEEE